MTGSLDGYRKAYDYFKTFPGSYGCKVGLIGLGAVGSEVAARLKSYRLEVCAYDPFASSQKADKLGVKLVSLEELFETCQTISNHVANLPETVGMLNANLFNRMKDNATFINTGRGAQVVEADMIAALKEKPSRTAILDVTFPEPPIADSELYSMPNVVLTPHCAGSSCEECFRLGDYIKEEAQRFLENEPLKYSVTLKMLETMA
jgi:phosphoglycerate dehydrogenase-like enzyme